RRLRASHRGVRERDQWPRWFGRNASFSRHSSRDRRPTSTLAEFIYQTGLLALVDPAGENRGCRKGVKKNAHLRSQSNHMPLSPSKWHVCHLARCLRDRWRATTKDRNRRMATSGLDRPEVPNHSPVWLCLALSYTSQCNPVGPGSN